MLKEFDLIHYQQQHPDQFRPYGKKIPLQTRRNILLFPFSGDATNTKRARDTL